MARGLSSVHLDVSIAIRVFDGVYDPAEDSYLLLRCLDVFVLPSLGEGISNTILEAMATGLPVVASRVGGNPELVAEGVTGTLFQAGDAAALAAILAQYCGDDARCRHEGEAARSRIDREFTLERMTAAYQAVYDGVLGTGTT